MCLLDGQRQAMRPCSQSVTVGGEQRQSPRERQRGTERQTDRHTEGDRDTDTWREKGHRGRDAHKEGGGRRDTGTCWDPSDPHNLLEGMPPSL